MPLPVPITLDSDSGKPPFLCPLCDKKFLIKVCRDRHVENHSVLHICHHCGKICRNKFGLQKHLETHSAIRSYQCDQCDKAYKSKSALRDHVICFHGKARDHLCRFCPMRFLRKSDRIGHERTHTNERPFKCSHCDKAFRRKAIMQAHELTHGHRTKDWKCDVCGSLFYNRIQRDNHVKYLHESVPDKPCPFNCGKMFRRNQKVKEHSERCSVLRGMQNGAASDAV